MMDVFRGFLPILYASRTTFMSIFGASKLFKRFSSNCYQDNSPLADIRVLDLTRIVAGPYCTMILGDLGAEVLKIEKPGSGDESRNWGPPFMGETKDSTYFMSVNRNKKSVCVDLKQGRDIIYELAKKSDVLVENYVPGKLSEMGLGYEDLKKIAPQLIYCSLTGYGYEGPYAKRPGYDVIAASIGGLLHITGPKNGDPCKVGVAMTDMATGLYAHGAILAALLQRMKTKEGQWIQCDLLSTQVASLINVATNYLNAGKEATRWGSEHESIVPYEAFPTKDGYMTVGTGSDVQFVALLERMDLTDLRKNNKFKNNTERVKNRIELLTILRDKFKMKTNAEWSKIFENAPYPYGPINTIGQEVPTVRLRLRKPRSSKKVQWTQGTVDNEHMNKKKSKCCCIYEKPKNFGESSSEDSEDECEHCHGHIDAHKKALPSNAQHPPDSISPEPESLVTGST